MGIKLEGQRKKYKIASMAILLAGACFVTYYFHGVLEVETVFTHSFYIPIILASIWWRKKGLIVAIFLAALLLLSHFLLRPDATPVGDYLRATMFVAISFVVGMLSDRIAKAHQATKLTHAELDRIFNTSGDAMCVIDKDFNVLRTNERFSSLSGANKDEAAGKKCHELFSGPLCHTADCPLTRILSGEEYVEYEEEKERNDGIRIPCIVTATALRGPDGKLIGIIEDTKDITERKRWEEALRESEERFRLLADNATDIIWTSDINFRRTYVSPSVSRLRGYTVEEAMAQTIQEMYTPASVEVVRKVFAEELAIESKGQEDLFRSRTLELEAKCKDGSTVWNELKVSWLRDSDGQPVGMLGITRDITERKRAEEAVRESEEKLRFMFESIEDEIMATDLQGNIVDFNEAALRKHGYTHKEEITGRNAFEIISPKDRARLMEDMGKVIEGDSSRSRKEYTLLTSDGSYYEAEFSYGVMRDSSGNPAGLIGVMRDITERKRAEEALQESEERYRLIAENVTDVIWVVDANMQLTYVSPSVTRLRGYSVEEAMAQRFEEWLTPTSLEVVAKILAEEGATENQGRYPSRPRTMELELTCKDGSTVWTELRMADMLDQDGKPVGTMGVSRDISERKRMEEERESLLEDLNRINARLAQSNKELQDFVYVASHDLREPLRKMASFGNLLQDSLEGNLDEDQQENLEFMIDCANRMQMMIDDLLTYSRVSTKAKPPEHVDLNEVIDNLKKLELAVQLDETKGTIRIPRSLPPVSGDPSQIHQLLQNLIGNGLKFHRDGIPPEITIRARQVQKNMVRVEVQDNGIGIDEQYHEQVFTMFKRLHSRTDYEGTGIGLAVCKKIVDRHGGEIGVKSTPGECSTFWLTLPRGSYS